MFEYKKTKKARALRSQIYWDLYQYSPGVRLLGSLGALSLLFGSFGGLVLA